MVISKRDRDYYMEENCHIFALALNEIFGYTMWLLFDEEDEEEITNVAHVFVEAGKEWLDIEGFKETKNIKDAYYDLDDPTIVAVTKKELFKLVEKDILMPITKNELDKAKKIILANKKFFEEK